MTNIRFFYTNLIDNSNVELTSSSESITQPVENLFNPLKLIPWMTNDIEYEYVDIDLGRTYQVKAFAAVGYNLSDESIITLCGDNNSSYYQDIDSNHIGFWKFDGSNEDSSGSSNDLITSAIASSDYVPARQDRAVRMDGSTSYFYIADANAVDFDFETNTDFTLEGWIKLDSGFSSSGIISKWNGTAGYYLEIDSNSKLHFYASDGTYFDELTGSTSLTEKTWYHLAITGDRDGQLNLYINGSIDATAVNMQTVNIANDADLYIGRHGTSYYSGEIALLAISNIARSSTYISDACNTPKKLLNVTYNDKILLECFTGEFLRYWRLILSDPDNNAGSLSLGRIYLGDWFEPKRNYHGNWTRRSVDPSTVKMTLNNIEFSDVRNNYIELDLSFPKEVQINQSDIQRYEEMFKLLGSHKRLFIALDYDNHPFSWSYYGTLSGDKAVSHLSGTSHSDGKWIINNIKFKESR
jgi:hypothetical protein